MGFGSAFGESWKDYQTNFWAIMKSIFLILVVPLLLVMTISYFWAHSTGYGALLAEQHDAQQLLLSNLQSLYVSIAESGMSLSEIEVALESAPKDPVLAGIVSKASSVALLSERLDVLKKQLFPYNATTLFLTFIALLFGLLATFGILASAVRKKTFSLRDVWNTGRNVYWKYLGAFVLLFIVLIVIFIVITLLYFSVTQGYLRSQLNSEVLVQAMSGNLQVLIPLLSIIIPYFILILFALAIPAIYWMFVLPLLADGEKSIFTSFGKSFELVHGRWWRLFGVILLSYVFFFILGLIVGGLSLAIEGISGSIVFQLLWTVFSYFVVAPYFVLFCKNLYFVAKKEAHKK